MRELDKTKVYSLEDLTSEEFTKLTNHLKNNYSNWENFVKIYDGYTLYFNKGDDTWYQGNKESTHNAKELFYTLENIQVDCRELSEEQVEEMKEVVVKNGYTLWDYKSAFELCNTMSYFVKNNEDTDFLLSTNSTDRYTITYDNFMELFAETKNTQPHYDNTNGSIYKFCNDQKLNSWEFDIIKRVVRCRKKGLFKEDLQKTKDLIDLYLKEFTDEK